jgi:hypothetical protein
MGICVLLKLCIFLLICSLIYLSTSAQYQTIIVPLATNQSKFPILKISHNNANDSSYQYQCFKGGFLYFQYVSIHGFLLFP